METTTSRDILIYLKTEGFILSQEQRAWVEEKIYNSVCSSYQEGKIVEKRGCDCGQMCCAICHG